MNINNEIKERVKYIDEVINDYLPKEEGHQAPVIEAMNYSILAGGKRLRPLIMKTVFNMFSNEKDSDDKIRPFIAAIEMIHTYSLVHDDLPAMDDDKYRRGKLTTHAKYGEALGILAGDGLLNYAFETALKAFDVPDVSKTDVITALKILFGKAGIYGMIGGQTLDVVSNGMNLSEEQLDFIFRLKTSALIEASMMVGAVMADAGKENILNIEKAARLIGLAFQIQDDVLDVTGSFEEIGKPVLSDEKNNKTTFVSLKGLDISKKTVNRMSNEAVQIIRELECDNTTERDFLVELVMSLVNRRS